MKISYAPLTRLPGFKALGKSIGIKNGKKDLGIVYSPTQCITVGVFTTNQVKAAPILLTQKHLESGRAHALIVNSGVANACTGKEGMNNAERTAELVANELGISKEHVVVMSTGIIGKQLPIEKIESGVSGIKDELNSTETHGENFAESILTTDLIKKEVFVDTGSFSIAGVAKGSGMIEPNMATMLGFIFTDAKLSKDFANSSLKQAVNKSFNCISVDGCQSTNDSVILMANGLAGDVDQLKFQEALDLICLELAKKIVLDGEGATKFIEVNVEGATNNEDAKNVAKSIINSNLVKTAFFGCDPNIGRLMAAIGTANAEIEQDQVDIYVGNELVVEEGMVANFDNEKIKIIMSKKELVVLVNLNKGNASSRVFGCDLSFDYVKINGHYRT